MVKRIHKKDVTIDAKEKILGRLASQVATLLIKNEDTISSVSISNIDKIKVSGKKKEQKVYRHHSGYPGGLKEKKFDEIFSKDPEEIFLRAVKGMLPKNKLRKDRIKRIKFI